MTLCCRRWAPVRNHRNGVRNRSEALSAFNRNSCPPSSESATLACKIGSWFSMGEFYEYLWALAGYGKWLLTGGPFLVENIIERVKPSWSQWLDKKIAAAIRLRIEI